MYYPCSDNKGADQLCGYRTIDLRLCFQICKTLVFSRGGSNIIYTNKRYRPHKNLTPQPNKREIYNQRTIIRVLFTVVILAPGTVSLTVATTINNQLTVMCTTRVECRQIDSPARRNVWKANWSPAKMMLGKASSQFCMAVAGQC